MYPSKFIRPLLTAIALGALTTGARAETAAPATPAPAPAEAAPASSLKVGDVAPALKPQKWLQGEPVTAFAKDKTYIIECWATWCGPCVAVIPHVNALHTKFKDKGLVIVGMNVWEDEIDKPTEFLKKKGDGMAYRVAFDGGQSGDTANSWLKAAGVNGIPHAFAVHDGKIIWHGHPGELEDAVVASMIAGKFDPAQAEKDRAAKQSAQEKLFGVVKEAMALSGQKKFDEALAKLASVEKDAEGEAVDMIRYYRANILVGKGDAGAAKNLIALANSAPDKLAFQYLAANSLLNAPELKDQRDPKAAKVCAGRLLAGDAGHPMLMLLDAQADYALGDKAGAEKSLTIVAASTDKQAAKIVTKAKAALEAVKAGKEWPTDNKAK
jgi:thiol-disulfide isomerase/thioredoxin